MTALILVLGCLGVLLIYASKREKEWLLNVVMRSVLGTIGIYFVNLFFASFGISLGVGVNAVTVLTCGILGFPGVLALYGVGIYCLL